MSIGTINGQTPPLDKYLKLEGRTMTGLLVLSGNPKSNLEAASKQYVDGKLVEYTKGWELIDTSTRGNFTQLTDGYQNAIVYFNNLDNIRQYKEIYLNYELHAIFRTGTLGNNTTYQPSFQTLAQDSVFKSYSLGPNQSVNDTYYERAYIIDMVEGIERYDLGSIGFGFSVDSNGNSSLTIRFRMNSVNGRPLASNSSYGVIKIFGRK